MLIGVNWLGRSVWLALALGSAAGCGKAQGEADDTAVSMGGAGSGGTGGAPRAGAGGEVSSGGSSSGSGGNTLLMGGRSGASAGLPFGAPGWLNSTEPLCDPHRGTPESGEVWADERGVFLLLRDGCVLFGRDPPSCSPESLETLGSSLLFNSGDGWRVLLDFGKEGVAGLSGFQGGFITYQTEACAVNFYSPSLESVSCSLGSADIERGRLIADGSSAFTTAGTSLLQFRSNAWRAVATLGADTRLLAAAAGLAYLASPYEIFRVSPGVQQQLESLPDAPSGVYSAGVAQSDGSFWLAGAAGQLVNYDGKSFRVLNALEASDESAIVGLWGTEDTLYFHSATQFGRVRDGKVERIIDADKVKLAPTERILGMYGRAVNEVFLVLTDSARDRALPQPTCGGRAIVWFDGERFHRF